MDALVPCPHGRSEAPIKRQHHEARRCITRSRTRREPYPELGAQYFDEHERDHVQRRLVHRLERLGYAVIPEALPATSRRFSGGYDATAYHVSPVGNHTYIPIAAAKGTELPTYTQTA